MTTVLDAIVDGVRLDLAQRKAVLPLAQVSSLAHQAPPAIDAAARLRARDFSVIAEVKRASPSKGHLADIPDPAVLARRYQDGGAAVVSVLTEQRRFGGSLADLDLVRAAVTIPILRKDFVVEDYQVLESRAHGADVVLLIVASLDDAQLRGLHDIARGLGMTVLVEVHDEAELERALAVDPEVVGINARNLKTLDVDLATCHALLPLVPQHVVAVAESGIATRDEVTALAASGARAVLVGEALVRGGDPLAQVREWTAAGMEGRTQ